ncbi:MAG: alpha-hydroxy-acid oxidizing protein, partial [Saprospiraceae bacterium]
MKKSDALGRQRAIYVQGAAGLRQNLPVDPIQLEQKAREKMSPEAFAYVAGGAGLESTMLANRQGFESRRIVPRMMRNVEARDLGLEVLGQHWP